MTEGIQINRVGTRTALIPIVGTSPLIVHKFSEKAKKQMLDSMQGRKTAKTAKDPQAEFTAAAYRLADGGYGMPAVAFKSATVGAARFYDKSVSMTGLRQMLFFKGQPGEDGQQMVKIISDDPVMREDVVRVGQGGTDLRYRPQFNNWRAILSVTYVESMLTADSVLSLIDAGGMGVGVGEWRPEKKGDFGTYQVDPDSDVTFDGEAR
jgi:hypothetical protein